MEEHGLGRHGQHRRTVGQLAVVAEDEVGELVDPLRAHPAGPLGRAADHLRAEHQVAHQPAPVGVADGRPVVGVLLGLGHVVEEHPGEQHVPVDDGVVGRGPLGHAGHAQGVLDQPAHVGVVELLGGRRPLEARQRLALEDLAEQGAQARVGERVDECGEFRGHLPQGPGAGGHEVGQVDRVRGHNAERLHGQLQLFAKGLGYPLDEHEAALRGAGIEFAGVVPDPRLDLAGAVHEAERQVGFAGLGLGQGLAGHEEDLAHLLARGQVGDEQGFSGGGGHGWFSSSGGRMVWRQTDGHRVQPDRVVGRKRRQAK